MSEESSLLFIIKAKTEEALRKINTFTKGVGQSTKEMTAFQKAGTIAAGVLLRDMVQGASAAFSETIKLGASIETLTNSFNALTKYAGGTELSLVSLRNATRNTVSDVDLLTAANTALALGLPVDRLTDLFRASVEVGHAMGSTTLQAISDVTRGIGRLSPLILDNLGIIVNTDLAYENYAATLGKTVSALTDTEKKTAFQTAAMESLIAKAVVLEGTTSDATIAQERFGATIENLKTSVGALLTPLGAVGPILEASMPMFGMLTVAVLPALITEYGALGLATTAWATVTAAAAKVVSASIYGIPILGWIAAAIAAVIALYTAWNNNWFGIQDRVKNASDFVMEKIGWLLGGVNVFTDGVKKALDWLGMQWAVVTGTIDEHLLAQQESLLESYEGQVQIIKDNMSAAVSEVETKYGEMAEIVTKAHSKEIEEHAQFWIDQITAQAEGFEKAVEAYQKHYNDIVGDTETHYDELISNAKKHYDDLLSETKKAYDEQVQSAIDFWMDQITGTSTALTKVLDAYRNYYDEQISEAKTHYNDLLSETKKNYDDQIQSAVDFWMDQITATSSALGEVLDSYNKHYDEMVNEVKSSYDKQISHVKEYYSDLLSETNDAYDEQIQSAISFWTDQITETASALDDVLSQYTKHYDSVIREAESNYNDQTNATNSFYDNMLAEQSAFLVAIREGRSRDLDDLELNFLLQKQSLEGALNSQQMTQEEYEKKLSALEEEYRDNREDVRDNYRIQELQAEEEFRTDEERINAERAEKLEQIDQALKEQTEKLNQEKASALLEITSTLGAQLEQLEQDKANEITRIEEELKARIEDLEQTKSNKINKINKERAKQLKAIERSLGAELKKLTQEKADAISAIEAELKSTVEELEQLKADTLKEIQETLGVELAKLAKENAAETERIENEHKNELTRLEQEKADEIARINEERNTALEQIRADAAALEKQHAAEMRKLENEKAFEIAGIQAQADLDIIKAQRQLHESLEKASKENKDATTGIWSDLWSSVKATAQNIADKFQDTISAAKSAYQRVKDWWDKATKKKKDESTVSPEATSTPSLDGNGEPSDTPASPTPAPTLVPMFIPTPAPIISQLQEGPWGGQERFAQQGFEGWVDRPTTFLTGEAGAEYVSITPTRPSTPASSERTVITIKGPLVIVEGSADEATARLASDLVMKQLRKYL